MKTPAEFDFKHPIFAILRDGIDLIPNQTKLINKIMLPTELIVNIYNLHMSYQFRSLQLQNLVLTMLRGNKKHIQAYTASHNIILGFFLHTVFPHIVSPRIVSSLE